MHTAGPFNIFRVWICLIRLVQMFSQDGERNFYGPLAEKGLGMSSEVQNFEFLETLHEIRYRKFTLKVT